MTKNKKGNPWALRSFSETSRKPILSNFRNKGPGDLVRCLNPYNSFQKLFGEFSPTASSETDIEEKSSIYIFFQGASEIRSYYLRETPWRDNEFPQPV